MTNKASLLMPELAAIRQVIREDIMPIVDELQRRAELSPEQEADRLRAEVKHLREALERIGKASNTDPFRTFDGMIQDMQMIDDIARAVLQSKGE